MSSNYLKRDCRGILAATSSRLDIAMKTVVQPIIHAGEDSSVIAVKKRCRKMMLNW